MFNEFKKNGVGYSVGYFATVIVAVFAVTFAVLYVFGWVPQSFRPGGSGSISEVDNLEFLNYTRPASYVVGTTRPDHISIPEIGVNTSIGQPETQNVAVLDEYLLRGAVHYPGSGTVDAGNIFLFGHSSGLSVVRNPAYKAFNNLNKLSRGDEIYIEADGETYVYKVTSVQLVTEDEALVNFNNPARTLTLSTCNTFGAKQERWVVEAVFDREV